MATDRSSCSSSRSFTDEEPSRELIERARTGKEEALKELIESWRTYLLNVADAELDQRLRSKLGASDIVQSACFDIYNRFQDFRGETVKEWKSWLRQLIRRDVQDLRRRFRGTEKRDVERERYIVTESGNQIDLTGEDLTPGTLLVAREESRALRAALQQLTQEHRQVIRLRNWEETSFAEIGKLLNRSEESARKLWKRAVGKLQEELLRIVEES